MTDDVFHDRPASPDPQQPADPLPPFGDDLAELAWLQCSDQLSQDCTGYVCAALLQWSMGGESWPDPAPPSAGPDCDHLTALERIAARLWREAVNRQPWLTGPPAPVVYGDGRVL